MTKVTPAKELEQYEAHNFAFKKTSQDKAYHAFLQSIYDENGELNVVGGRDIPEKIVQICRVYDPIQDKEYLVYDVTQWGYFEDGSRTPTIHIQDVGVWKEYTWHKVPVEQSTTSTMATGEPQRRKFKDKPESHETKYELEFSIENVDKLRRKSDNSTMLYVYDLSKNGRGGKDGKIGVQSWVDFKEREFNDLIEGTYLVRRQYELQLQALKDKENFLNLKESMLNNQEKEKGKEEEKGKERMTTTPTTTTTTTTTDQKTSSIKR